MQKYLTDEGMERPTLAELVQQIGDQMFNALGPINRNPNSGIGQMIAIYAEALGVSYEVAEEIFNSRFIRSASGLALDAFGDWYGLPRRAQTKTTTPVILYGDNNTIIRAGSVASYANHNFTLDTEAVIVTSNTTDITFRVSTSLQVGEKVAINFSDLGKVASVTMATGDTPSSVARELAVQANLAGSTGGTTVTFTAVATGTDVRLTTSNVTTGFSATVHPNSTPDRLTITRLGSPGQMTAEEAGAIVVPAHQLTKPVTGIAGWIAVDNPQDASVGADRESDTDYRRRLQSSDGTVNGLATPQAIKRVVQTVSGVTAVTVLVNEKMYNAATGQVAKSYQVVVNGGQPGAIGEAIYSAGGAGIETWGTSQTTYIDPDGVTHYIFYSRPTVQEFQVKAIITYRDLEEVLTPTHASIIEQAVREYFLSLSLGEDIVPQRMLGPIYAGTEGIAQIDFQFKQLRAGTGTGGVPPVWDPVTPTNGVIPVPATATASLDSVTVEVP